ncbi:DUF1580 domain-containing protein [bacterium]|nr:DUF1580 domain-containing protein [bacterium]
MRLTYITRKLGGTHMTITDHISGERLTPAQASRLLDTHIATTWRYMLHGVRGVRLESWLVGARRYTTAEAVERFLQRLNADTASAAPTQAAVTSRRKRQAHAAMSALTTR